MRTTLGAVALRWALVAGAIALATVAFAPIGTSAPPIAPVILNVTPEVIHGPDVPGLFNSGTFEIRGKFLKDGEIFTDGPIGLTGSTEWSRDRGFEVLKRDFSIGCCAPYDGQVFNLIVVTPQGNSSIQVTIQVP
jgi:hypothetical protein